MRTGRIELAGRVEIAAAPRMPIAKRLRYDGPLRSGRFHSFDLITAAAAGVHRNAAGPPFDPPVDQID
jgi:hypothetical protein